MKKPTCECIHRRHGADIEVFCIVDQYIDGCLICMDEMKRDFVNFCPQCGKEYKEESCLDCDGACDTTGECKHGGEEE